jgi:gluconate 5-dehydrogenase
MSTALFDLSGKVALVTGGQVIYVDGGILANFGYVEGENKVN